MADFDPDAYLAATEPKPSPTPFDPDAYLQAVGSPKSSVQTFAPGSPREIARQQLESQPVVQQQMERAGRAIADTAVGFVKGLPSMAKFIAPPTLTDILGGAAETLGQIKTARESPIGSQEWWNAVVPVASQYAMQLGAMRVGSPKLTETLFGKKPPVQTAPLAAETAAETEVMKNAKGIPENEARYAEGVRQEEGRGGRGQNVEQASQGRQDSGARSPVVPVPQPEQLDPLAIKAAAYQLPNGEIVSGRTHAEIDVPPNVNAKSGFVTNSGEFLNATEAHERAKARNQIGKTYDKEAEKRGFATLLTDEQLDAGTFQDTRHDMPVSEAGQAPSVSGQPKIISSAVQTPEGIKTGETWNEPHDSITARVVSQRPSPTQETGIAPPENLSYKEGVTFNGRKFRRENGFWIGEGDPNFMGGSEVRVHDPKTADQISAAYSAKSQPIPEGETRPSGVAAALPEEQKGFMVQDSDGTQRFVGREEAAGIAKAAGQVKPENAGTTELHSQQLAPTGTEMPPTATPLSPLETAELGRLRTALNDFIEHEPTRPAVAERPSSPQALGILPRPSEFVRQDVAKVVTGISKGFRQIKAALTPANVSPIAGQTARIVREHAGQLARDNEIAMTALRDAAQVMRRNSKAENLAIIDRLEKGQPLGNKGLDDYKTIRQAAYDQRIKQVQDVNPKALQDLIENYFPHLWTRESIERLKGNIDNIPADNPWGRIFGKRPLTGPASFLKQRTIPTTAEGIALGLEPVTTNPVALDLLKMHEMDRYVMGHKIMQEMKDNGLAKFVPTGERPDFGYVKINDRIARVFGPRGWKIVDEQGRQMPGQKVLGDYYAPEDAARIINNYLSPGLRGNAVYDSFRFVGNAMNQVQLGISAYHAFFTAIDSATSTIALGLEQIARSGGSAAEIAKGAGQIAKGFIETPVGSMIENLWRGNKFLREYSKPGTTNAELAKIVDAATSGGSRVRMDTFYNTGAVGNFFDALKSGNYTGAVLRAPLALVQTISKPLMEYTVPRLKLGIISQQLEYELSKLPKNATQDQVRIVAGRVVDSVDNRMGQLIYDNLFWNKALKDGLMASVRSVGWNLGDIRELGGGALDSITAPKRAYTALTKGTEIADNPVFTKRMAYTFALPFYVGVLGSVYQYLMTGKGPQSIQDAFMPRTGRRKPDGTEERVMLPTYMKDVYPLALATAREGGVGLVSRGYRMAVNKLHPALSSIGQMIHNQDYYGNQILSPDDPLIAQHPTMGKIFREAEFIGKQFQPFSFRGVAQREGGLKEKLQAVAGIMPATRELTDTPAMRMIHDINMAKRPSGGYTQAQQRKREDRRKVQKGEDLRPMLFKRLSNEEKARVLEVATPEERAIFQSGTTSKRSGRLQMQ